MASLANQILRSTGAGMSPTTLPSVLFIQAVPDDGFIEAHVKVPEYHRIMPYYNGSLDHFEHLPLAGFKKDIITLVGTQFQKIQAGSPRAVVNCIVDTDASPLALKKAVQVVADLKKRQPDIAVINPPEGVLRTTRDQIHAQFKNVPGLHIPHAIRVTPVSVADMLSQIEAAGMHFPVLVRGIGSHGGKGLQRVDNASESERLKLECYAFDGREFYVTEFVDFKDRDGLYRKSRLISVGGRIIPRHRIVADNWNIHARSRETLMKQRKDLRKEEAAFLAEPFENAVNADVIAALKHVYESLGLDYFGIDCSIREDGSLLVFEINTAFNAMVQSGLDTYPYLAKPLERIKETFNELVTRKASLERAA